MSVYQDHTNQKSGNAFTCLPVPFANFAQLYILQEIIMFAWWKKENSVVKLVHVLKGIWQHKHLIRQMGYNTYHPGEKSS